MSFKLLTEQHLESLSLKGGCTGSFKSIHAKMPHCWKSRVAAQLLMPNIMQSLNSKSQTTEEIHVILILTTCQKFDLYMYIVSLDRLYQYTCILNN